MIQKNLTLYTPIAFYFRIFFSNSPPNCAVLQGLLKEKKKRPSGVVSACVNMNSSTELITRINVWGPQAPRTPGCLTHIPVSYSLLHFMNSRFIKWVARERKRSTWQITVLGKSDQMIPLDG